jgi:hypothetical protein
MLFGKRISEYIRFQQGFLVVIAAVGLVRLFLSLAGLPDSTVRWFSMNVPAWAGILYYGYGVHRTGFGTYKHVLPLGFFQNLVMQSIAVLGILLAMAGLPNIYAAPEYSFGAAPGPHLLAHLTVGMVVPPLLAWGVGSLVLLITKKAARRPAVA